MRRLLLRRTQFAVAAYPFVPAAALAIGLSGCAQSAPTEATGVQGQAVVNPTTPVFTAPSTADLAPLSVWGSFTQAGTTGAPAVSGQYTGLTDLDVDPTPVTGLPVSASAWLGKSSTYATAPNFSTDLGAAASAAISLTTPDPSDILSLWTSTVSDIFGNPDVKASNQSYYGFAPVAGRYIESQWGAAARSCIGKICFQGAATQYTYPAPPDLQEQRERGARLFCAARAAQQAQGSNTIVMGEQAAVSFTVLGQNIQLLVVEPMISIDGPQKFVGTSADGSQAFVVPMKFGTRVTPIKAFGLPSLPEIRYPVALVSGDSEVATDADYGSVYSTGGSYTGYEKEYVTVEHMDGYVVGSTSAASSNTFPLFTIGPVDVNLTLGLQVSSGTPMQVSTQTPVSTQIASGRLLAGVVDGSVVARTATEITSSLADGPWNPKDFGQDTVFAPFSTAPGIALDAISFPQAFYTKATQNDDHYLEGGATSVILTGTLGGVLGLDFGPVQVNLSVTGGISGGVEQLHMVRDAAFAQVPHGTAGMVPATGIVVRPRTEASVSLGPLAGALNLSLDLGLFSVSWTLHLFSTGTTTLASYDSDTASTNPWPASSNLEIGTGSGLGADITNLPTVDTQLPNGAPFQALSESVSACLTDPKANPPDAPACGFSPATPGTPPSTDLCATSPTVHYCSTLLGTSTSLPTPTTYTQCADDITRYLCGITPNSAGTDVSTVMTSATLTALGTELQECGKLAVSQAGMTQAQAETYLSGLLGFQVCNSSGTLVGNIFGGPSGGTGAPPVSAGGSCN